MKLCITGPLESTDRWFLLTQGQWWRKRFHVITTSWCWHKEENTSCNLYHLAPMVGKVHRGDRSRISTKSYVPLSDFRQVKRFTHFANTTRKFGGDKAKTHSKIRQMLQNISLNPLYTDKINDYARTYTGGKWMLLSYDDVIQYKYLSVLMALCEGNPPVTGGFPSQSPMMRSFCVLLWSELTVGQTIETPVIWDAIALIKTSV